MNDDELLLRARGCMVGSGVGDALGAATEFMRWAGIQEMYGPVGLTDLPETGAYGHGVYTDDTQMAVALARAITSSADFASPAVDVDIRREFARWYRMQVTEPDSQRSPGATCMRGCAQLAAESGFQWTGRHMPRSDRPAHAGDPSQSADTSGDVKPFFGSGTGGASKGNGAVMRLHPLAIAYAPDRQLMRHLAHTQAWLTHDHKTSWFAARVFAVAVADVLEGMTAAQVLTDTMLEARAAVDPLARVECSNALAIIDSAIADSKDGLRPILNHPSWNGGWTAETATAMAIAAYAYADRLVTVVGDEGVVEVVEEVLLACANCDGDSDTVGCMTGALLGAAWPRAVLEHRWASALVGRAELEGLAFGLVRINRLINGARG
jgi:ADP-ribosylglycohydrolase